MAFNSYTENTLLYKQELCINCGACIEVCPHGVFSKGQKTAFLSEPKNCMECGGCMLNCPKNAIYVESGAGCAWGLMIGAITGNTKCDCSGHNANFSNTNPDISDENSNDSPCCCGK